MGHQRAAPPIVVPSVGALGGRFASPTRPLGGVAPPRFPAGVPPQHRGNRSPSRGYRYVGPIYYTPGVFDSGYDSSSYSTFNTPAAPVEYGPPPSPPLQPQQPIIINQYFTTRDGSTTTASVGENVNPGDLLGDPQKYYLIAYKDHTVYTALAYWMEGDILHYVTTQNTHNQASMALIDVDQTAKLNADKNVPFSLTAK
jgi:hypothetical protein